MAASLIRAALSTQQFAFITPATPREVWASLTDPIRTARYLFDMAVEGAWTAGQPLVFRLGTIPVLRGQVLAADEPRSLSYCVNAGPEQPDTYVTWEVRPVGSGAVVRLTVDEMDGDMRDDMEIAWLTALAALEAHLRRVVDPSEG